MNGQYIACCGKTAGVIHELSISQAALFPPLDSYSSKKFIDHDIEDLTAEYWITLRRCFLKKERQYFNPGEKPFIPGQKRRALRQGYGAVLEKGAD